MAPGAAVVAGPRGGIALGAGIGGAGEHEGPFLRLQLKQSFVGRAHILHAVDIVDGAMIESRAVIQAMNDVKRHGLIGTLKERRFIHVIPEARRAHADEVFVEPTPPFPHARQSEIRKQTFARPNHADIHRSIRILHEYIVLHSRIVRRIAMAGILLDVQVGDQNRVHALRAKIGNHFFESRKILAINRKRRVAILKIDIEVDDIRGYFFLPKRIDDFPRARFRIVRVPALLISERPERRKRGASGHGRVSGDDFLGLRPGNEVVVQLAAFGAEGKVIRRLLAKIEHASMGVVDEKSISRAFAQPNEEGNGFVKRVRGLLPAELISIPICKGAVAAVHGAAFVAEAEVIVVERHLFPYMNALPIPGHWQAGFIREQYISGIVRKIDEQGRFLNRSDHVSCDNSQLFWSFFYFYGRRICRFDHGPGGVLRKGAAGSEAHAENAIAEGRDADFGGSSGQLDAVFELFDALDFANVLPALCNHRSPAESTSERANSDVSSDSCHCNPPGNEEKTKNDEACFLPVQIRYVTVARRQAASHCSKNADAFAPSMRRLTASITRHRAVSPPP